MLFNISVKLVLKDLQQFEVGKNIFQIEGHSRYNVLQVLSSVIHVSIQIPSYIPIGRHRALSNSSHITMPDKQDLTMALQQHTCINIYRALERQQTQMYALPQSIRSDAN